MLFVNTIKVKALFFGLFIGIYVGSPIVADISSVITFPADKVGGRGPLPYNCRLIDGHIYAGGHPLNPANDFGNTDAQTLAILAYLHNNGVKTVIDLENSAKIQARYSDLLHKAGLKRIHIPLSVYKLPNKKEWERIKEAVKQPVYLHCKYGADRTGMVIGRYLVECKGYPPQEAYKAVISGGTHAGSLGGLKTSLFYMPLKRYIFHGPKP